MTITDDDEMREIFTSDQLSEIEDPTEKAILERMKLIEKTFKELEQLAPNTNNVQFYFDVGDMPFEYQPWEEGWSSSAY